MPDIGDLNRGSENMTPAEREARAQATYDEVRKQAEEARRRELVVPMPPEPREIHVVVDVDVVTVEQRIEEMGSLIMQATAVIEAMTAMRMQMEEMLAQAEATARDRRVLDEDDEDDEEP